MANASYDVVCCPNTKKNAKRPPLSWEEGMLTLTRPGLVPG